MKSHPGLLIFLFVLCQAEQIKRGVNIPPVATVQKAHKLKAFNDTIQPEEFFVDSLNIGRKRFNKIEVSKYRNHDSNYVIIKFFSKQNRKWNLRNKFQFEKDGVTGCDTKLSDFNNDGLKDMTYISAVAARGANEVRRLFIYDKIKDKLIFIKNSEDYPNMLYDKELNCIDAFLVYGGCSTVFLRIQDDNLKEFASVQLFDGLTVTEYDKYGKEKILLRDTTNKALYVRYKNYKPLKENDDY
jgi:hypothetical protein